MQRFAIVLCLILAVTAACGGPPSGSSQPQPSSPSASPNSPSASPSPEATANPAQTILAKSEAVMLGLGYTVHRRWLRPQPQTAAPVQWKPGQPPETTMVAIDSPVYSFASTTDTSPQCPNAICYVVRVTGIQRGSSPSCAPPAMITADVYIDGQTYRNLSRHVVGSGGGGSGCPAVDLEGSDSISFP